MGDSCFAGIRAFRSQGMRPPGLPLVLMLGCLALSACAPGNVLTPEPGAYDGLFAEIARVSPEYPKGPAYRGVGGKVVLDGTVYRDGRVRDIEVVESYPDGLFDRYAVRAFRGFRVTWNEGAYEKPQRIRQTFEFGAPHRWHATLDALTDEDQDLPHADPAEDYFVAVDRAPLRLTEHVQNVLIPGEIQVRMRIEADGHVSRADIADSHVGALLNPAIMDSIEKWKFHWRDGVQPQPILLDYTFYLDPEDW